VFDIALLNIFDGFYGSPWDRSLDLLDPVREVT
jgi:hypothetical protein